LITRHTIEEKIMGLQEFKVRTANTVISAENSSLQSMATDRIFDLFSLDPNAEEESANATKQVSSTAGGSGGGGRKSVRALLEGMEELWDESQYDTEYDINAYVSKNKKNASSRV
jgi:TATA-binding protein-associated factor